MTENLTITLIQTSLHWENIPANLEMFSQKIAAIKNKTDLIILPEMFSTGFSMNAPALAEEMQESATVKWMSKLAAEKNCVITGSLILKERGRYFNRLIWMSPDGSFLYYDKRHLFSLSKEEEVYTPGEDRIVVELKGWKICPLVCYDLRFPVWSRNSVTPDDSVCAAYDLLLYVANWPERRNYAWKHLLIARAIENQSYVAGVNRVGNDNNGMYHSGDSMAVDALGKILYHEEHEEKVFTIELNMDELIKVRESYRFLQDADSFIVNPKFKMRGH